MALSLRKTLRTSLLVVAVAASALVTFRAVSGPIGQGWQPDGAALDINLARPDVFVDSTRLSALPRDMLKVPVLKDVLTEDFVFYYEQNDARLSLSGTLRRLAYEQDLDVGDELVSALLNRPGQVSFWRGKDGTLRYWMLSVDRSGLPALMQTLGKVALSDSQLHAAGSLQSGGDRLPLLALEYGSGGRTLLLASKGDRLLVFSDPAMVVEANPDYQPEGESTASKPATPQVNDPKAPAEPTRVINGRANPLLAYLDAQGAEQLRKRFASQAPGADGHQLVVRANYLSFGYQTLFPAVQALGFRFEGQQWQTQALIDGPKMPAATTKPDALWSAMPSQAALCSMLPVQTSAIQPVLDVAAGDKGATAPLLKAIDSPVGVCWYAKSGLTTPLFAVALKDEAAAKAQAELMGRIFAGAIGTREFAFGKADTYNRFPVQRKTRKDGGQTWQRVVSARYGSQSAKGFYLANSLSADRYFPVSLGQKGRFVYFSPDARLVDDALSVAAGQFPSAADGLAQPATLWLRANSAQLAKLLESSAMESMPADSEPIFHDVAEQRLLPRLKALATQPSYSVRLPESLPGAVSWVPVTLVAE